MGVSAWPATVIAVIAGSAGPYRVPGQNLHFGASKLYLRSISAAREITVLVENINLRVIYVRQKRLYMCGQKLYVRPQFVYLWQKVICVRVKVICAASKVICAARNVICAR